MTDMISLLINDIPVSAPAGTTILDAAKTLGVKIPTICFHEYCTSNALCRICVVEVEGSRTLVASCVAKVSEGMKVHTQSQRIITARRTILEMLASSVDLSDAPDILDLMQEYGANDQGFPGAVERKPQVLDDNPLYVRDYARCILCWRCVQVCAQDAQYTYAINFTGRGYETQISTFFDLPIPETTCVFCGQCIGVCPTGALKPKRQWLLEQGYSPDEIVKLTRIERREKTNKNHGKG